MGIENKGQILHPSSSIQFVPLEKSFDGLRKHTAFDYMRSGSVVRPNFYLHPIEGKHFDFVEMISYGVILEQELKRQFSNAQITSSPGRNMGESFMFPQFTISDIEGFREVSGLIYPTAEYAKQVVEDDILMFEAHAFPPASTLGRETLHEEIRKKKIEFPKFEIPFARLNEVLTGS